MSTVDQPPPPPPADGPEHPEHPELEPLPYDGVLSVTVGTLVWLVALIVMLPFTDDLRDGGHSWWIAPAATGFGLGLLGVLYCVRRRNRLRRATA